MSDSPIKTCDYCEVTGKMPTFMDGETICYSCLGKRPKTLGEAMKRITELEAELEIKNNALLEAADDILNWSKAFEPEAVTNKAMIACRNKYRTLAKGEK